MKILRLLIVICLLFLTRIVYAQKPKIIALGKFPDSAWLSKQDIGILKSMKLVYKKPVDLIEVKGTECFDDNAQLGETLTCAHHQLHSGDEQFIAFITIYKIFTKQDSIDLKKFMPGGNFDSVDKMHANRIRNDIRNSLGKEAVVNWKQYVTYYTPEDAKSKFNADTAISLPISFASPKYYYKGVYNHLEALYLQKKGRGFVNFYCFYIDEAEKNLPLYRREIESVFKYED